MSYTVRFRDSKSSVWETIKDVVSDDIMVIGGIPLPIRVLILKNHIRIEIPLSSCVIEFSKERALETEKERTLKIRKEQEAN